MQVRDTTARARSGEGRDPGVPQWDGLRAGQPRPAPASPGPLSAPAGTVILELSKEKTNERLLDRQAAAFTASVQHVEAELSGQIRYLTQVRAAGRAQRLRLGLRGLRGGASASGAAATRPPGSR